VLTLRKGSAARLAVCVVASLGLGAQSPPSPDHAIPAVRPPAADIDSDRLFADLERIASPELEGRLTGSEGSRRTQAIILDRFKALGLHPVAGSYTQPFSFTSTRRTGPRDFPAAVNVLGLLPGTRAPDAIILVSAHYDHVGVRAGRVYPGADDNASGVAGLLALAEFFVRRPPAKSLLFVAFDGEEQGLRGARHFVAEPPVPLERIETVVNLDMIARGDNGTLYAAGTYHYPFLKPVVLAAGEGRTVKVAFGHDNPDEPDDWTQRSDQAPFHARGIPFIFFSVEDHPDYHQPTDTPERVPRAFYAEAVDVVRETVRQLAELR
jgi:hypothetical protein